MNNEAAIHILLNSNEYHHAKGDLPHSAASIEVFNKAIDALKADRSQGEWVYHTDDYIVFYTCSKCKGYGDIQDKFCRHCGADMRKGGTE